MDFWVGWFLCKRRKFPHSSKSGLICCIRFKSQCKTSFLECTYSMFVYCSILFWYTHTCFTEINITKSEVNKKECNHFVIDWMLSFHRSFFFSIFYFILWMRVLELFEALFTTFLCLITWMHKYFFLFNRFRNGSQNLNYLFYVLNVEDTYITVNIVICIIWWI